MTTPRIDKPHLFPAFLHPGLWACINVDHLEPGTQLDNMRDCLERGRFAQGTTKINSALDADQIKHIRAVYIPRHREYGTRALARKLCVAQDTISRIVRGDSYKDVT